MAYTLALPEGRLSHATGTGYLRVIYGISAGEMTDDGWQMTVEKERAEVKIRNREEKA